ncbi:hypothetical protein JCM10207_005802 [Rhodosporidiobolus poonsookiae]
MSWGGVVQDLEQRFPTVGLAKLNLIAGLCNLFTNGFAFFSGRLADRYGARPILFSGATLATVSMIAAAVSQNSLPLLFIFQGLGLGLAFGLGFPVFVSLPSQWFVRRRGLATGIAVSGTGFGGALLSLLIRYLLPRYGYRTTLLIWAAIIGFLSSLALLLASEHPSRRTKHTRPAERKPWLPSEVWRDGAFYSVALTVFVGIFGYLVPTSLLNIYTQQKVSSTGTGLESAVPLIASNVASGCGRILAGLCADQVGPVNLLVLSFLLGGVLQIAWWAHATSLGSITAFAAIYGLTASWMVSLLPPSLAQLFTSPLAASAATDEGDAPPTSDVDGLATLSGFMLLCNAPGMAAGPTIAGAVLSAAGGDWKAVAYYGGGCMVAGGVVLSYARFSREKRLLARY